MNLATAPIAHPVRPHPQPPPLVAVPTPVGSTPPRSNRLLAALLDAHKPAGLPQLQAVELPLGRVLHESRQILSHAYFPTTAVVSMSYMLTDGHSADIAVVGNDGMIGIALIMGGETTPSRAVVQSAGWGFRMPAAALKTAFEKNPAATHLLLRYTQALITQMSQMAVCNRHHSLDQQLSRWLLTGLDRREGDELRVTQEQIANMLGVRREGVTEAALKLQAAGVISYARGRIRVLDRGALQNRSCECYRVVKREYERLLP